MLDSEMFYLNRRVVIIDQHEEKGLRPIVKNKG